MGKDKALDTNDRKQMLTWAFNYQIILYELEQEFQSNSWNSLEELKNEWGQISHFQRWCVQHLATDNGAAMMCSKFAGVGGNLLNQFQSLSRLDLIQWREAGLAGARKAALVEDQISHLTYLSYAHFVNNNAATALDLIEEAIELGHKQKDSKEYAAALQHRGMFYARMEREAEAIEALNDSISIFEKLGDDQAKAKCLSVLATCHSRLNEPQKAIDLYNQAIEIEMQAGDRSAVGTCFCNMSGELMKLKHFAGARDCLSKVENIANELSDLTLMGLVYAQWGQWHAAQENPKLRNKTWCYYEDALTMFRKKGERYHELQIMNTLESLYAQVLNYQPEQLSYEQQSTALRKLIQLLFAQGKLTDNLDACNRLLAIAEANHNLPDKLEAAISLGNTLLYMKRYHQAIQSHTKAIAVLQDIREQDGQDVNLKAEGELHLSLGQAYRHSNQPDQAIQCYKKSEKIAEVLHNPEMQYRAVGNRGLTYADTGCYSDAIKLLYDTIGYYEQTNDHQLQGHAQFNLAYAYYRKGDLAEAKSRGAKALRYLIMINDSHIEGIKHQIDNWEKKTPEMDKS